MDKSLYGDIIDSKTEQAYVNWMQAYVNWIKPSILFHDKKRPQDLGGGEVEAFFTCLVVERKIATPTQNQALSAIFFLYREVLGKPIEIRFQSIGAKRPKRLAFVLKKSEVQQILARLSGEIKLVVQLLYGSGLRFQEAVQLRIKDIDFEECRMVIREGKRTKVDGVVRRCWVRPAVVQRAARSAATAAKMAKHVAIHLLEAGCDIRAVQELWGHKSVKTRVIYTQVLNRGPKVVHSLLDPHE